MANFRFVANFRFLTLSDNLSGFLCHVTLIISTANILLVA